VALIAAFAAVAVPGSVGSQDHSPVAPNDPTLYHPVGVSWTDGTTTATPTLDPAYRSDGALTDATVLMEPDQPPALGGRPNAADIQPEVQARSEAISPWHHDGNVSWYGPGFYGKRTACGYAMTETLRGVANRTLPCGTKVTFRNPANGRTITVAVVDRGPYVTGRQWDLTGGLCLALDHCYTGSISWKLA
jgi:rare lipoprotein A (RlpA)-like double-psi beta-barrel protein